MYRKPDGIKIPQSIDIQRKSRSLNDYGIFALVVDDTRLELVTSRTSSGCATSCANRPAPESFVIISCAGENVKDFFVSGVKFLLCVKKCIR